MRITTTAAQHDQDREPRKPAETGSETRFVSEAAEVTREMLLSGRLSDLSIQEGL